ncbi:MAG TPA: DUF2520 domain-containing protein [Pyrinomonadaceae bacterium]
MPTKKKRTAKPTVSIIGAGRLGTAIAIALSRSGYKVVSLVGRRRPQVRKAAAILDGPCELLVAKEITRYTPAELVIVAVPDDSIAEISDALDQIQQPKRHRSTVLHTSGALSSAVFRNLKTKGWYTGSLHPLISVSDPQVGATAFRTSFWCVEGDTNALRLARQVVRDVGGSSFTINSKDKPLYHAAAVMSSGNVIALFDVALEILERCGLERRQAQKVLLPLLQSTVSNLFSLSPETSMTGPFSRGDLATVRLHTLAISEKGLAEALEIYRLLGRRSLKLSARGLPPDVVEKILRVLRESYSPKVTT